MPLKISRGEVSVMFEDRFDLVRIAKGEDPADIVFQNCDLFNPFDCTWERTDFAVARGRVIGTGPYRGRTNIDLRGRKVVPGLIDAHAHIESSLLLPGEFTRIVSLHGTTTVIADPHEIANVCGIAGIEYMCKATEGVPVDIFFMLPSCVPASRADMGGARLTANDLQGLSGNPRIIGLGEVMDVPGVLGGDPDLWKKLGLCEIVDGHAPGLGGKDLNAYLIAGPDSDHESTSPEEALEKLRAGMHIFLREGSTERNLEALIPIVNPCNVSRCSFSTDDRHADTLVSEGHIDDCIRKSIEYGLEPVLALRMATLSAAERFGLNDRGALVPGRLADFCVLEEGTEFLVHHTWKYGSRVTGERQSAVSCNASTISCKNPDKKSIVFEGKGIANVIGLVLGGIITTHLKIPVDARDIPDLQGDILKVVVCNRYREQRPALGLVHGFGMKAGAIASSVSHDSHHIVAVGTSDRDILHAIGAVISYGGALVSVSGDEQHVLPLECAGLMSVHPYEEVVGDLDAINAHTARMGCIASPFMYLQFLGLSVIPSLRITDLGLYDVAGSARIGIFGEYAGNEEELQ